MWIEKETVNSNGCSPPPVQFTHMLTDDLQVGVLVCSFTLTYPSAQTVKNAHVEEYQEVYSFDRVNNRGKLFIRFNN